MDNQNKDRMTITMQKTDQRGTPLPGAGKKYSCSLPVGELFETIMFEIYEGLQAMGYDSKSIAHTMHECAWQREPEIFSEEEQTEEEGIPMEVKKAYQKFYDKWLNSRSFGGYMELEEFSERFKMDSKFAEYWSNQIV